jgi:hypothetical protein
VVGSGRAHDHVRNGITSRFAAFNIADGIVITEIRRCISLCKTPSPNHSPGTRLPRRS